MFSSSSSAALNPNTNIIINDQLISSAAIADFISVTISEDLDAPSMFDLKFYTWDLILQKMTWVDSDLFEVGNKVEIKLGYEQSLKTVILGEITGLEPEFSADDTPILIIRGHDFRHRLLRGHQTKSFLKMKDSDIALQIAQKRGLTAKVTDSQVKLEYVLQQNQTDWEFLKTRGDRIGYEVVMEGKNLYFRPHQNDQSKVLTLTYGENLLEFFPRLSSLAQVEQVEVRGWIPKDKKTVISQAGVGKESSKMGGKKTGSQIVKTFRKSTETIVIKSTNTIVDQPVSSKAEADQIALGKFQDLGIAYITAEGSCEGIADLRAGKVVKIAGVGKRFSGLYYVNTTEHIYSPEQGYQTSFTARRNAT
jgi:phage protein D